MELPSGDSHRVTLLCSSFAKHLKPTKDRVAIVARWLTNLTGVHEDPEVYRVKRKANFDVSLSSSIKYQESIPVGFFKFAKLNLGRKVLLNHFVYLIKCSFFFFFFFGLSVL